MKKFNVIFNGVADTNHSYIDDEVIQVFKTVLGYPTITKRFYTVDRIFNFDNHTELFKIKMVENKYTFDISDENTSFINAFTYLLDCLDCEITYTLEEE